MCLGLSRQDYCIRDKENLKETGRKEYDSKMCDMKDVVSVDKTWQEFGIYDITEVINLGVCRLTMMMTNLERQETISAHAKVSRII